MADPGGVVEGDGILRFQVRVGATPVVAFISRATCAAHETGAHAALGMVEFYELHRELLDDIVSGKVRAGARHPVVVMAQDLVRRAAAGRRPAMATAVAAPSVELRRGDP